MRYLKSLWQWYINTTHFSNTIGPKFLFGAFVIGSLTIFTIALLYWFITLLPAVITGWLFNALIFTTLAVAIGFFIGIVISDFYKN